MQKNGDKFWDYSTVMGGILTRVKILGVGEWNTSAYRAYINISISRYVTKSISIQDMPINCPAAYLSKKEIEFRGTSDRTNFGLFHVCIFRSNLSRLMLT
jgi:hypothetical protein